MRRIASKSPAWALAWVWMAWVWIAAIGWAGAVSSARAEDRPEFPRRAQAVSLVRSTLATLNDANLTGNYAVLRAKSAPAFQTVFSAATLEKMFKGMRDKHVDLSRALAIDPEIANARFHTVRKVLQFTGVVRTAPVETRFAFSYQSVGGVWKLYGLSLDFEPTKPLEVSAEPPI